MMKKDARLITIASDAEGTGDAKVKEAFFIVEPKQEQLIEVARLLDSGRLRTFVDAVVSLEEAGKAYLGTVTERLGYGKVVVQVSAN
jgi:NADPH:quinone reductase-like Zn-dependent oxidoreductase